jgi:hypothetical protein
MYLNRYNWSRLLGNLPICSSSIFAPDHVLLFWTGVKSDFVLP